MKIVVYPADKFGCGHFRMIWPAQELQRAGHDVEIVTAQDRRVRVHMEGEEVTDIEVGDTDVIVFQRLTHRWMVQTIPILRRKGVAVVVDIDDDLTSIDPNNPAWWSVHPRVKGQEGMHAWKNLNFACREATLVTTSTPELLKVYASHGRGIVLYNYLPEMYYGIDREDSDVIGWPASFHSHPGDPGEVGGAISRLVSEGATFRMVGDSTGAGAAFGLPNDPPGVGTSVEEWPVAVAGLGVGIAPLADTKFNRSKSWLKPLEMSALGVPWVASPRAEYARLNGLGAGVLAERPRTWYRETKRLWTNAEWRTELSQAGRSVAETLRLRDHAWRWLEAWQRALVLQRGVQSPSLTG